MAVTIRRTSMSIDEKLDLILKILGNHDERFDEMDRRFVSIDERFDEMDRRFVSIDERFDEMDRQIADLKAMDEGILEEIVRVHHILEKHMHDPNAHRAGFCVQ
jgi:uncharacterized coiled-coil DUF342 family protein